MGDDAKEATTQSQDSLLAQDEIIEEKKASAETNPLDENAEVSPSDYVVVAEDSGPNRTIITHLMTKLGFAVIECADGEIAWNELNQSQDRNIVAIISDIMMPKVDGIELLKRVRSSSRFASTPVLLVTAVSDKEYIFEAKKNGVNGYILKPLTFQRIITKLRELFPDRKFPQTQEAS